MVTKSNNKAEQISELLRYFSVASFSVLKRRDFLVEFSSIEKVSEQVVLNSNAWIQTVLNFGNEIETKAFNEMRLKSYLAKISMMGQEPAGILNELSSALAECGVAFVRIPSLKNSCINAVAKWLNKKKAVIGIASDIKSKAHDDYMLLLLHGLDHVLQKKITKTFVSFKEERVKSDNNKF